MKKITTLLAIILCSFTVLLAQEETKVNTTIYLTHQSFDSIARYVKRIGVNQTKNVFVTDELLNFDLKLQQTSTGKEYLYIKWSKDIPKSMQLHVRVSKSPQALVKNYTCQVEYVEKSKNGKEIFKQVPQETSRTGIHADDLLNDWFKIALKEINLQLQPAPGVPVFEDALVQKVVNEYAIIMNDYISSFSVGEKDEKRSAELSKKLLQWGDKMKIVSKKLALNPNDAKKFGDFMETLSKKMMKEAQKLNDQQ